MNNKGFSLINALVGVFLLGIIFVTIIPILTSAYINISRNQIKMEMNYIGEMALEKIKSFDENNSSEVFIFDKRVSDIVNLFKIQNTSEITLKEKIDGENYCLRIIKEDKKSGLWLIQSFVYHDKEGSKLPYVEYRAYIPKK